MNAENFFKHFFFWLSGAGSQTLEACPNWEQRKYVAFGATVLVPTLFAFIAASYALSTLTDQWAVIIPVALAWAFIIMTIDRALLATYRSYQSFLRKSMQFALRIGVAILMGFTISHPLTLLIFKDSVHSVIEEDREKEIADVRKEALATKASTEVKITALEGQIGGLREKWHQTFQADFLAERAGGVTRATAAEESAAQTELAKHTEQKTAPYRNRVSALDEEMQKVSADYAKLQGELEFWQREFERELNGQRSGIIGLGPRAKSIQTDHLQWRRDESVRTAGVLEALTHQKNQLLAGIASVETQVKREFDTFTAEQAERQRAERDRVAALRHQVQQQQASSFVTQQDTIRDTIAKQIDTRLAELSRLQDEVKQIAQDEQQRIGAIKAEPRRDILTQTLALHQLFQRGAEGGHFALIVYVMLTLLFMLIDTIPLVLKFFSKPGPYDMLVDCEEVRFDREREAFLKGHSRYMEELSSSRILHRTLNKPLEQALIDGVDRSRAAKEFLEALLEMERTFDERMQTERLAIKADTTGTAAARAKMLEELAENFYRNLRGRMEAFFDNEKPSRATG
jgi:hypothetical protein